MNKLIKPLFRHAKKGTDSWQSERQQGLDPARVAFGTVCDVHFLLPLGRHEHAFAVVVLDRRADRKGLSLVIGHLHAVLLIGGDLLVQITAHASHPVLLESVRL